MQPPQPSYDPRFLPVVIQCPACRRSQGSSSDGRPFECMFCGDRIDPLQAGPPPTSLLSSQSSSDPTAAVNASIEYGGSELVVYRWWNPRAALAMIGRFLYTAFILLVVFQPFLRRLDPSQDWYILVVGAVVFVGVVINAYRLAAYLLNRTTFSQLEGELRVRHAPLPWVGNGLRLALEEIGRISMSARRSGGRSRAARYSLVAEMHKGGPVTLIPELSSAESGDELVHLLNNRLGLNRAGSRTPIP